MNDELNTHDAAAMRILGRRLEARPDDPTPREPESVLLKAREAQPLNLPRILLSHGVASLPPAVVDGRGRELRTVFEAGRGRAFAVRVTAGPPTAVLLEVYGGPGERERAELADSVRRMLRLDDDLAGFYRLAATDPDLSWAVAEGAGRMLRSPTVFEDLVKTVCTTNCSWAATERMVGALVEHAGTPAEPAAGVTPGRAFPSAAALADRPEAFFRDVARAGYRSAYLRAISRSVAAGETDLEALAAERSPALADDEVERRLLALPGVGPYAAAHLMLLLGRCSRLVFDSWTVPKYRRLTGRPRVSEKGIARRFRRYGPWAGLAFWLFLTRDWV